jgi:hypothetical protein
MMTSTTIAIPKKALQRAEKRYEDGTTTPAWDLYLDGALVASEYISPVEALMELDLAAWYALFGEASLSPDMPITDEALALALTVFNRLFRAEKVQEKARMALEKIIRAAIYTIKADGSLSVLASSGRGKQTSYIVKTRTSLRDDVVDGVAPSYQVTMECACRDFYVRAHDHGGICKHVTARLLLFLAQLGVAYLKHLRDALDTCVPVPTITAVTVAPHPETIDGLAKTTTQQTADTPTEDASAFLTIGASDLAAALFLAARAAMPVEVRADHSTLQLVAGMMTLSFPCLDGDGTAAIRLEHAALSALYEQLRPVARSAGVLNLFVEPSDGLLFLCDQGNTDFSATASGQAITIAANPASETTPAPEPVATKMTPIAETPAVAALYELFTLLEQHEPDWYLRRHERVAHQALCAEGRLAI